MKSGRRSNGDGVIRELYPGKWRAEIRINGGRLSHYANSPTEAQAVDKKDPGSGGAGFIL